ncbi:hypothetical protein ACFDTO_21215 [Microbacteriaceae bacterium 4G12]
MVTSKPLGHDDESGFEFAKEMLAGDLTAGINFDRLQKHPKHGYIIFEYLRCKEDQPHVTPHTSHPKYYWNKNKRKFLSLWQVAKDLKATLFLVNYAKKGETHKDKIKVIRVIDMNETGITKQEETKMTRADFQKWFRKLNSECL